MTARSIGVNEVGRVERDIPVDPIRIHPVVIKKVVNGFVIEIGCKVFVSEHWGSIVNALTEYWNDPEAARKKYAGDN